MKFHQTLLRVQSILAIVTTVYGIEEKLLCFTYKFLKEIDLNTGVVRTLIRQNEIAYSIAYDHKKRYMYVPRYSTGDIVRFPYPNNHTVTFESIVSAVNPIGIAFDSMNNHVYWTETYPGKIMRCNADGSRVKFILNETYATALTLDIRNRWIYYGQQESPGKIFRATFDGIDKRVIIKNIPGYVYGLRLDFNVDRFYWMVYQTGYLRSAGFNGSDDRTIVSTNVKSQNWDIDMDQEFIFYTSNTKIMKINKSLKQNPEVVHIDTQQLYGLLFYKQEDVVWCMIGVMIRIVGMDVVVSTNYSYEWTSVSSRCTNSPGSCDYKNCN